MNTDSSVEEFVEDDLVNYDYRELIANDDLCDYNDVPNGFPTDLNDVEKAKWIIKRSSVNSRDINGYTLLDVAILEQKREVFDYLITLEDITLGSYDLYGETPLILACKHEDSYFAKRLIQIGVDVDQCSYYRISPLHCAIENCLETTRLLLENGADVNYLSPLEVACWDANHDAIHMLLYYGAIVSIVDHVALMHFMSRASLDCQETLLLHYLDEIDIVDLDFISMIVRRKVELFPIILERITEVDCDSGELNWDICDVEQLVALLKKFPDFRNFFFKEFHLTCFSLQQRTHFQTFTKLIFKLAEESLSFSDFFGTECGIILTIVEHYEKFNICKTELTELILILISYGLRVCFADFLYVNSYFGNGFLVKLFLHITIEVPDCGIHGNWLVQGPDFMGVLLYKPIFDFNCIFEDTPSEFKSGILFDLTNPISTFRYFANSKFYKFVSEVYPDNDNVKVLIQQPHFPSLIELSRNACQRFIYSKWEISDHKPGKYYDIVKRLPIPNVCKQILTFDVELYTDFPCSFF